MSEYLIEALDAKTGWYVVGSDRLNHIAQEHMRRYRRDRPTTAFRVVEYPSRILQVLIDPLTDAQRAGEAA